MPKPRSPPRPSGTARPPSAEEVGEEADYPARGLPRRDRSLELLLERQRAWADELIIYSTRSIPDLERAVHELDREFRRHREDWDPFLRRPMPEGFPYRTGPLRLLWEHEMFLTSLRELRDHVRPLRTEDRPAHRWALGQFWRLVLEIFGDHLEDERGYRDAAVRLLSTG